MSKPVKEMIVKDYQRRFGDLTGALVVDIRGIPANDNNALRLGLAQKQVRVSVVKNTLARKAFAGTALEPLGSLLEGPSALAYGAESVVDVARALVEWARKVEDLDLKGAVLDGELFEGEEGVKRLSRFPTRDEAIARVVQVILSPGRNALGAATGPGGRVAGIIKEVRERLERGETVARIAPTG